MHTFRFHSKDHILHITKMNDIINMGSTIAVSMYNNIKMGSTIAVSMYDIINMGSTIAVSMYACS